MGSVQHCDTWASVAVNEEVPQTTNPTTTLAEKASARATSGYRQRSRTRWHRTNLPKGLYEATQISEARSPRLSLIDSSIFLTARERPCLLRASSTPQRGSTNEHQAQVAHRRSRRGSARPGDTGPCYRHAPRAGKPPAASPRRRSPRPPTRASRTAATTARPQTTHREVIPYSCCGAELTSLPPCHTSSTP